METNRGFTLVEVIVALLILSFLSLFTVEAIQRAIQTKSKVQTQIDKNSNLRDALRIMERDINMAFNYRDISVELYNQTQQLRQKSAEGGNAKAGQTKNQTQSQTPNDLNVPEDPNNPDRFKQKQVKVISQFLGSEEAIDFTSLSNVRMMEDSQISSQAEIGYKLKPCRRRSNQEASSNCLWRRISNYIHDDITRNGQETVLLENVTEFKLRYLGPGKEESWVQSWYSNEKGDDLTKGKFPYAVEITLAIKDDTPKAKDKELRMTSVAAIRNPNNPPQATTTVGADGQPITDPNAQGNTGADAVGSGQLGGGNVQ